MGLMMPMMWLAAQTFVAGACMMMSMAGLMLPVAAIRGTRS